MNQWLSLPQLASQHGGSLDHALGLVHWLMLVLFVGWGAFFVYVLWRFRARRHPVADHMGARSHASTWLEGAVALVEAVLLIGFSIPLWADRVERFPAPADSTRVRVVAEQFAWNIHYPGPDGVFGRTDVKLVDTQSNPLGLDRDDPAAKDDVTTINQLHLPVGRPVLIQLTSKDVIHSFALQEMRVKQDAVPGSMIPVWFVPTVTTEEMRQRTGNPEFGYEISCAQLCGLGHYRMRGYVTIHTAEEFQKWMDERQAELQADTGSEDSVWK
jgi:cytochrome c oxidase subunit 2